MAHTTGSPAFGGPVADWPWELYAAVVTSQRELEPEEEGWGDNTIRLVGA